MIEHIEVECRVDLLGSLNACATPSALLALAYPSPEYQRHLAEHDPDELQIIENCIEAQTLVEEAARCGWELRAFRYVGFERRNQYIYAVFGNRAAAQDISVMRRPPGWRYVKRLQDRPRRFAGIHQRTLNQDEERPDKICWR